MSNVPIATCTAWPRTSMRRGTTPKKLCTTPSRSSWISGAISASRHGFSKNRRLKNASLRSAGGGGGSEKMRSARAMIRGASSGVAGRIGSIDLTGLAIPEF